MVIAPLIERKRDGGALAPEEWRSLIQAFALGEVPDYQVSALAMAVMFRGLEPSELAALTEAMLDSGDRLRWDGFTVPRVDKHSTGGVGDNTSLLLVPLVAAVGVAVPMMSGRALGHTGGTLDKLEAIAGFRTRISLRDAEAQVRRIGCVMLGQTNEIAPADARLYALRDVTGTVESVPLIASSIMSKKLAEGLDRTGARREAWQWRVPAAAGERARAGADDDRPWRIARVPHRRPAHGHGPAPRPRLRQRTGG